MRGLLTVVSLVTMSVVVSAQLRAPNAAGASAGHHIFRVKDVDAANRFWAALGAEPTALATIKLTKLPGVLLFISGPRGNAPATALPGNHGTTVEFLTFKVKDLKASLAKWTAAGVEPMKEYKETTLLGPDDIQVRITEGRSLTTPTVADGLIMNVANAADVSAWYAKWFGAQISHKGNDTIGDIPGAKIVFRETKDGIAPLRGHSLGLLGFEVIDIEGFVKRYREAGGT